ncbi:MULTISPECIES: DUF6048 family protein [Robiginitalea]|uniref:DUF6048 family protein n=1 Tax=Robiginitalea TaxID=252306 RepID=UPI00030B843B|nr:MULTISPECIES: DUF6048 family protein [Robiginitalea]MDC6354304.1 DUF6048 family protein [Robiginitalea sp. PM2]MDC6374571.1 DUF6048 family protein [Robiginitalea sp. SP8]
MLRFTTSLILILAVAGLTQVQGQQADSLSARGPAPADAYGIRLGADLSRLLITGLNEDYQGFELVGDYRISEKFYLAAELGNESRRVNELLDNENDVNIQSLYDITSRGSYLKAGLDYNTYTNWYGMNNQIIVGARAAFSSFRTDLDSYSYFNSNRYWNPDGFQPGPDAPVELDGLSAAWIELLLGVKAELFANIYMGASVRLGMLVSRTESDRMPHLWIPGFNRVTDGSSFGVGFNYTISYFLPLYRKARENPTQDD